MPVRKLLKDKIRKTYWTQDKCAYELGINNGTLSRIVNCTLDPTDEQMEILCKCLGMKPKDVNKKED